MGEVSEQVDRPSMSQWAHQIRLRRPWQCRPQSGCVAWHRHFHSPTGLAASDRVLLCLSGFAAPVEIELNGHPLSTMVPGSSPSRVEITERLQLGNALTLEMPCPQPDAQVSGDEPPGEVWLEICPTP